VEDLASWVDAATTGGAKWLAILGGRSERRQRIAAKSGRGRPRPLAPATMAGLLLTTGCAAPQASTARQSSTAPPASVAATSSPVPPATATPAATASGQLPGGNRRTRIAAG
jgi:hypothetical protein